MTIKTICLIIIFFNLLAITGCTSEVTYYRDVQIPHEKEIQVPYEEQEKVEKFRDIPRVFPLPDGRPMHLAILPFTSSTGYENDGIGIAEEIEYAMLKHPEAESTYKLLNRTQLNAIFTEKELSGLNSETIMTTRKLLQIEGLITGHIQMKSRERVSFILKAINTQDASVLFTQRFEGDYNQSINDVVGVFYDHRVPNGWETQNVTKYRTEKKTTYTIEKEPYTVTELDSGKIWTCLIIIGVLIYAWSTFKI